VSSDLAVLCAVEVENWAHGIGSSGIGRWKWTGWNWRTDYSAVGSTELGEKSDLNKWNWIRRTLSFE
jgi:hypothetical protein